jgi:hypothetical protein
VATKDDLVKKITDTQVNEFINKYDLTFISTSSLSQTGINNFQDLINDMVRLKWSYQINNFDNNLIINNVNSFNLEYKKKKGCC